MTKSEANRQSLSFYIIKCRPYQSTIFKDSNRFFSYISVFYIITGKVSFYRRCYIGFLICQAKIGKMGFLHYYKNISTCNIIFWNIFVFESFELTLSLTSYLFGEFLFFKGKLYLAYGSFFKKINNITWRSKYLFLWKN